jgi:hypothetical protein
MSSLLVVGEDLPFVVLDLDGIAAEPRQEM